MTFNIPDEILDLHETGVDALINKLGKSSTLVYPPTMTECSNCIFNPIGNKSSNIHRSGGPVPFPNNSTCPACNGSGYQQTTVTESVTLKIYWLQKDSISSWANLHNLPIKVPDGSIVVEGFIADLPKIQRAIEIKFSVSTEQYFGGTYRLFGEPILHGFRQNKYFLAILQRI